jgi:hypothetical protein
MTEAKVSFWKEQKQSTSFNEKQSMTELTAIVQKQESRGS